jgi:exodeoxyribonuclease-5
MIRNFIIKTIKKNFSYEPTACQESLIEKLADFLEESIHDKLLVINGYAGTGKTSIISAFVKTIWQSKRQVVLLAPTGRAAKVISVYSKANAFTIHEKIYRQRSSSEYSSKFVLSPNLLTNTIFIVDEASMISNSSSEMALFGTGNLLNDLIEHVYNSRNCKLILVGDIAQLPPVGMDISPALNPKELQCYGMPVITSSLKEVVRQSKDSGILHNATKIRNVFESNQFVFPKLNISEFPDVENVNGANFVELLEDSHSKYGLEDTVVITRSNKRANAYNQGVRQRILYRDEELESGDLLMVVRNNYYWAEQIKGIEFIANGDIAKVMRVYGEEERYGFKFMTTKLQMIDNPDIEFEAKILTDSIYSEYPSLSPEQSKHLFEQVYMDYMHLSSKKKRYDAIKEDPFYNALQIKFAYSVTCHKAQGGQWSSVFIDHGFITDDSINKEFVRWLYTAFTRATEKLYLINFDKNFFEEKEEN